MAFALVMLLPFFSWSQQTQLKVFEEFQSKRGTQHHIFQKSVTRTDASQNVYIAGSTINTQGNYDMLVVKLGPDGSLLWSQSYNGPGGGDDVAADVQIDANGNVYIAGSYFESATDSNNAILQKYDSGGNLLWSQTYNGTGSRNDGVVRIEFNGSFVYCVGSTYTNNTDQYDFLCLKYDTSGNFQWTGVWDNAGLVDIAIRVKVKNNKVSVAGGSQINSLNYKYAVVNFDVANGAVLNSHTSGGNQTIAFDQVTDMQVDAAGNIYITGGVMNTGQGYDFRTEMLDATLTSQWAVGYNGVANLNDMASALYIDSLGNIIVTGYTTTSAQGKDYLTIKYNASGNMQWAQTFNGTANGMDSASAVVVGGTNRIYVTGTSFNGSSNDYYTLRYDQNGNLLWQIGFNGIQNGNDHAFDIASEVPGNIFVVGQAQQGYSFEYVTMKYIEKNVTLHKDTISFTSSSYVFTENREQLLGTDTAKHPEVKFYTLSASPAIYFMDTAVSYVIVKDDTSFSNNDSTVRVDLKFLNSNPDQKIRPLDVRDDYCNFFIDHLEGGRSRVQNYNQLASFNVWNGVDIVYGSNIRGLKYYFVCKPTGGGGSASQIDLFYEGADSVRIDGSGQLIIYTAYGNIVQPKAHVWQLDASGNYSSLAWQPSYTMLGTDEVGFTSFGSYNTALPLIIAIDWGNDYPLATIDNLIWSTFYGQGVGDIFWDIKVAHSGVVSVCGQTNSFGFPTANALQAAYGQQRDAIILNFAPNGARNWATFYGGFSMDAAEGIDVDTLGNIYFVGYTYSPPASAIVHPFYQNSGSAYVDSTQSGGDGFIVHLRADGQFVYWASYLGGTGVDRARAVAVSPITGDIYVVGAGDSTGFPVSGITEWDNSYGGGMVWKFRSDGELSHSGFIGPNSGGAIINGILVDDIGHVVIAGATPGGFPVTAGCAQFNYAGGTTDGFLAKLSGYKDNLLIWATYHGGEGTDGVKRIDVSPYGTFPYYYATGYTQSDSLPVTNPGGGAYIDSSLSGTDDAFVVQYDSSGTRIWATYYGGNSLEEGADITTDNYGNIYFTGYSTGNDLELPGSNPAGSFDDAGYNGGTDAFIVMFNEGSHAIYWATYFGGTTMESPSALDCSGDTALYFCGQVATDYTTGFPFSAGYYVPAFGQPYYDQATTSFAGSGVKGFIAEFTLVPMVVGIDEPQPVNGALNVYPNPAEGNIWIDGNVNAQDILVIEIVDILGQVVFSETLNPADRVHKSVDVSTFATGMYVVRVVADENIFINKILIQK